MLIKQKEKRSTTSIISTIC